MQVVRWINEIESATSIADLQTSYSITGPKLQTNFEVLDSKIASGLNKIINGGFIQEEAAQKTAFSPGGNLHEYSKVSKGESVLDLDEILKVELKNNNEQSFNTRWDETIIAMKKQSDNESLKNLLYRQLQQSEQLKPLLFLYIHDAVQKGESRDQTRLKNMVVRYLEQEIRERAFLFS